MATAWQDLIMTVDTVPLAAATERTRTGDLWVFRGRSTADRLIQTLTNAPVNHVGIAVVLEDMPPLMWHAEMGRALPDVWTGRRQRGVQLHDLEAAVRQWAGPYGQRAWFRQISPEVGPGQEDALLESIARLNGVSFPSTGRLAARWARGRWAAGRSGDVGAEEGVGGRAEQGGRKPGERDDADAGSPDGRRGCSPLPEFRRSRTQAAASDVPAEADGAGARGPAFARGPARRLEAAYCAEVVGATLEEMGILLPAGDTSWYDPGRFWSGDSLPLAPGWGYGREIAVTVSPGAPRR